MAEVALSVKGSQRDILREVSRAPIHDSIVLPHLWTIVFDGDLIIAVRIFPLEEVVKRAFDLNMVTPLRATQSSFVYGPSVLYERKDQRDEHTVASPACWDV